MKFAFIITLLLVMMFNSCSVQKTITQKKMRGMYSLYRFEALDPSNDWVVDSSRIGYSGYILYDGLGHMAVHLSPKGYKDFDVKKNTDSLSHEELLARSKYYESNYVYFANAKISGNNIVHERLSATAPGNWGVSVTRQISFHQDTLYLTTTEKVGETRLRLKWVKMK